MTTRKKKSTVKAKDKRPKIKRETLKDLSVKSKGLDIRGGCRTTGGCCAYTCANSGAAF